MDVNHIFEEEPTVYETSEKSWSSKLDLVELPATNISELASTDYIQCSSLLSTKDSYNPLEFRWIYDNYGLLQESMLGLDLRIVKQDGTQCEATDVVAPTNLFFHALFSNLQLYLNGQLVLDTSNFYPWTAYLQRALGTSQLEKDGYLKNEMWYPNTTPNTFAVTDAGFNARYQLTKNSTQFYLLGSLLGNFFNQNRYIPSGTECRIVLKRSDPYLYLDCAQNDKAGFSGCPYKAEITNAVFYAAQKTVSQDVVDLHREQLSDDETFKYVTNEVQMKAISVQKGMTSVTSGGIVIGKIPKVMVFCMLDSEAFNGNMTKSAFNFEDFNISELNVTWNGENRVIPYSFKGDDATAGDNFLLALQTLRKAVPFKTLGNGISRDNYLKGNVFTAVELLPNFENALSVNQKGQVKIGMKFKKPLEKAITVLVYCLYQGVFELDKNKQIQFEH